MKLLLGVKPENYKLTTGNLWIFNPDSLEGVTGFISLHAAKNDSAAFQIVLSADEDFLLNTGNSAVFSQHGQLSVVRLEKNGNFDCTMHILDMHKDNDGLLRADALLSYPSLELKKGETRAVYCEIMVPRDTAEGVYPLRIRLLRSVMFGDEEICGEINISLEVLGYVMHDVRENKFHLDLWQHSCNIARKCETPLWSDAHFTALESYVKSLGELGQKAVTVIVSEAPWAGQSCFFEQQTEANLFEYSIVKTVRHPDGAYECDYTAMQRYIDLCAKYSIDREISVYGLCGVWQNPAGGFGKIAHDYPDAVRIRYYDEASGSYKYIRDAAGIDFYISSLDRYFTATRQSDKVRIAADEPGDIDAYRKTLGHLKKIAPSFKFKAAINHAEFVSVFRDEVYDFVPSFDSLCVKYPELSGYIKNMSNKRFLYYVCCGPSFPNTFLSNDLTESYYLGVLASYAGLNGFLRWNYTVWNDDPRSDIRYGMWKAGDTNFVYPQKNGAPLLSLRYKALKRSIQLYELLEELRASGDFEALDDAYGYVLRERDITKCSGRGSVSELCSTEVNDYFGMKRFVIEKLASMQRKDS